MYDFQEFIAGTGDLTSNWPSDHLGSRVPKDRATKEFWAIDLDGITLLKVSMGTNIRAFVKKLRGQHLGQKIEYRHVRLTEEDYREEDALNRKRLWEDIKYK